MVNLNNLRSRSRFLIQSPKKSNKRKRDSTQLENATPTFSQAYCNHLQSFQDEKSPEMLTEFAYNVLSHFANSCPPNSVQKFLVEMSSNPNVGMRLRNVEFQILEKHPPQNNMSAFYIVDCDVFVNLLKQVLEEPKVCS
jgi:hypothetical protein